MQLRACGGLRQACVGAQKPGYQFGAVFQIVEIGQIVEAGLFQSRDQGRMQFGMFAPAFRDGPAQEFDIGAVLIRLVDEQLQPLVLTIQEAEGV